VPFAWLGDEQRVAKINAEPEESNPELEKRRAVLPIQST
jgi:hypothetical protein